MERDFELDFALLADSAQINGGKTRRYLFGGGPSAAPGTLNLWGMRLVAWPKMAAGTRLVLASQAVLLYRRQQVTVEATNAHSDFFVKNLTAIRAEERLALAVYQPAAIGTVTGLT